eukprot:ANDGO_06040.mRNA.1 CID domain-containing protein 1
MSFNESSFRLKLGTLQNTAQSIQTLSAWITLYSQSANLIVETWASEFQSPTTSQVQRLVLLNLANDVLQTSRKQTPVFREQFSLVLPRCLETMLSSKLTEGKVDLAEKVSRILEVWKQRAVLDESILGQLFGLLNAKILSRGPKSSGMGSSHIVVKTEPGTPPGSPTSQHHSSHNGKNGSVLKGNLPIVHIPGTDDSMDCVVKLAAAARMYQQIAAIQQQLKINPKSILLLEEEMGIRDRLVVHLQDLASTEELGLVDTVRRMERLQQEEIEESAEAQFHGRI